MSKHKSVSVVISHQDANADDNITLTQNSHQINWPKFWIWISKKKVFGLVFLHKDFKNQTIERCTAVYVSDKKCIVLLELGGKPSRPL